MKAIEALEDPAYYVDIEPVQAEPARTSVTSDAPDESGNLLQKFQK